jgi:cell division protein FtsB
LAITAAFAYRLKGGAPSDTHPRARWRGEASRRESFIRTISSAKTGRFQFLAVFFLIDDLIHLWTVCPFSGQLPITDQYIFRTEQHGRINLIDIIHVEDVTWLHFEYDSRSGDLQDGVLFAVHGRCGQAINELARSALELCQPLQTFGDRLRRISKALLSMRGFREELAVLSEFFEPIDVLNKQITQLEVAIQAQLAEIATTLDSTKTLKARIAELDQSVDSVSELETHFL